MTEAPHTTAAKLADLRERMELAAEPGGEKAVAKREKKGIPSARARIHELLDPGTFLEIGALAKTPGDPAALYGDGVVTGHGRINGRPVAVFSHGGVINVLLHRILGTERLLSFHVDYASVTRLLSSRTGRLAVAGVNGTEHVWDLLPRNQRW